MKQILFVLAHLVIKFTYDMSYVHFVSPTYGYAGLLLDINLQRVAISYVITALLVWFLPYKVVRPSAFFVLLLYLFIIMPTLSFWAYSGGSSLFIAEIMLGFSVVILATRLPKFLILDICEGRAVVYTLTAIISAAAFFFLASRGALRSLTLNPLDVYDIRAEVHETVMYGVAAYLIIWFGKVANVATLVWGLWKRNHVVVVCAIAAQVVLYGSTGHKELALYPLLVMFIYYTLRTRLSLNVVFSVCIGLIFVGLFVVDFFDLPYGLTQIFQVIIHRSFTVIAQNHFAYFEFFQNSPLVYMSNSALSSLSSYPYLEPVPILVAIGRYPGVDSAFANTGFLASGYMHFGVGGLLLYSLGVGIVLRIYDALISNRMPLSVGVAFAVVPVFQLVNSDLLTALLTHGIGLGGIFLWCFGHNRSDHLGQIKNGVTRVTREGRAQGA